MSQIKAIKAREVLDSRGVPTVEVDIHLDDDCFGRACVPSGASVGSFEAYELRDTNSKRYYGKGVLQAVNNIKQQIAPQLIGYDVCQQKAIDELLIKLDGTANKKNLGANAILGVSLACAKAASIYQKIPLYKHIKNMNAIDFDCYQMPIPMMNFINGGVHAYSNHEIQELMIIPICAWSIVDIIRVGAEIFHSLKQLLTEAKLNTNVGDEGGFAPSLFNNAAGIEWLIKAGKQAGYIAGKDFVIAIDAAANEFFDNTSQCYTLDGEPIYSQDLVNYYEKMLNTYPIVSIEDGIAENDLQGWKIFSQSLSAKCQLVGDDLFATNSKRLQKAITNNIANSILIKPNQIGTLTETLQTIDLAKQNNYNCIISHRSGETADTSIAHIAVGTNTKQIKIGSLTRIDRIAKYNELIRIEENLLQDKKIILKSPNYAELYHLDKYIK